MSKVVRKAYHRRKVGLLCNCYSAKCLIDSESDNLWKSIRNRLCLCLLRNNYLKAWHRDVNVRTLKAKRAWYIKCAPWYFRSGLRDIQKVNFLDTTASYLQGKGWILISNISMFHLVIFSFDLFLEHTFSVVGVQSNVCIIWLYFNTKYFKRSHKHIFHCMNEAAFLFSCTLQLLSVGCHFEFKPNGHTKRHANLHQIRG